MLWTAWPGRRMAGPAMAAFTTQARRFTEQLSSAGNPALAVREFSSTLSTLRLQIAALAMDCPPRNQEQACRAATRQLDRQGWGDDINVANISWLVSRSEFRPFSSRDEAGQRPASERLAALAAWRGSTWSTPSERMA